MQDQKSPEIDQVLRRAMLAILFELLQRLEGSPSSKSFVITPETHYWQIDAGYLNYTSPEDLIGKLWWVAVNNLQELGAFEYEYERAPEVTVYPAARERLTATVRDLETESHVYVVKMRSGNILVNEYLLAKPHFNSQAELVFSYILEHPGIRITKRQLEADTNTKITRHFTKILNDLGFSGEIKRAFFPTISSYAVEFRQEINKLVIDRDDINEQLLNEQLLSRNAQQITTKRAKKSVPK